jgi:hypothetical protein
MTRQLLIPKTEEQLKSSAEPSHTRSFDMLPSSDVDEMKARGEGSIFTEEHVVSSSTSSQDYQQTDEEKQGNGMHEDVEPNLNPLSTAVTTESIIPPPPDGGLHAWLKVFGGFFIYVNIW